jgi:hypothetical protein
MRCGQVNCQWLDNTPDYYSEQGYFRTPIGGLIPQQSCYAPKPQTLKEVLN